MSSLSRSGLLVTLDGPAGAGKTTVTRLLAVRLTSMGFPTLATTEPTRTRLGNFARDTADEYKGLVLACIVAADRYLHLETEVRPALRRGEIVLSDRYVASSLAIQRMDGVDERTIWELARHIDLPDLAIILNADPDVLTGRLAERGTQSRWQLDRGNSTIEASMYHDAVAGLRARDVHVVTIDSGAASPDEIVDDVTELISKLSRR